MSASVCSRAVAVLAALLLLGGCERSKTGTGAPSPAIDPPINPPAVLPEYRFAEGLREQYPEVCAFLRDFLETCLAGDYAGYRRHVSRFEKPESRERFEVIYHALRRVAIEKIEPLGVSEGSSQPIAYLVVSAAEFDPQSNVSLRHRDRGLALLVVSEDGGWRMRVAPPEWQPSETPPPQTSPASAPTTQYPWDEDD